MKKFATIRFATALICLFVSLSMFAQAVPPSLIPLTNIEGDLSPQKKDGKWGFADNRGRFVIPAVFDFADLFIRVWNTDGTILDVAKIKVGEKWGYVSRENIYFIYPEYDEISNFDYYSTAVGLKAGKKTLFGVETANSPERGVNTLVAVVRADNLDDIKAFNSRGLTTASANGKWGIIDTKGEWKTPGICDKIVEEKNSEFYRLESSGKIGYSSRKDGCIIFKPEYRSIEHFSTGTVLLDNGKVGLATTAGDIIIPVEYKSITPFLEKFLLLENGKKGVAQRNGKIIVPVEYDSVSVLSNGKFLVKNEDGYNVYTREGQRLFSTFYTSVSWSEELDAYNVAADTLHGRLDPEGKVIYPCIFASAPDPEQTGHIEMMIDDVPYIFLAGEREPVTVSEYDDVMFRQMTERRYQESTILPNWLKKHLEKPWNDSNVLLAENTPRSRQLRSNEDVERIKLSNGKYFKDVFPYDLEVFGGIYWNGGKKAFFRQMGAELYSTLYMYDTETETLSSFELEDKSYVFDFDAGIIAESPEYDRELFPVTNFRTMFHGFVSTVLCCYMFHSWAGQVEVSVCPNGGKEYVPAIPGEHISLSEEVDLSMVEGSSGSYCSYDMLIHEPAENGIALYEIIKTSYSWKKTRGVAKLTETGTPETVGYGFIGLGRQYFVQPIFAGAKDFDGDKADVLIGNEWKSLSTAEIDRMDPFVMPDA